jgi:hypothetical protein
MAGGDVEKAGLEERLEAYYSFEFEKVKTGNDGKMYAAGCGGASDQHVQATIAGHEDEIRTDGWARGPNPSS